MGPFLRNFAFRLCFTSKPVMYQINILMYSFILNHSAYKNIVRSFTQIPFFSPFYYRVFHLCFIAHHSLRHELAERQKFLHLVDSGFKLSDYSNLMQLVLVPEIFDYNTSSDYLCR